jgi:DNA-directed RNA polymerase subunit RPC12/RpoP
MDDFNDMNIVDTKEETDKKCSQCGGVMDFDPATGNLKCPYCDYEETIKVQEDKPKKAEELDFYTAEHTANRDWGVETKTVLCKACGAESIYDALQTAAVCPFCGSNQVMDANDQDTIAPGGVVPFKISDKQASELFHKWIKRRWFCPKLAKDSAKPKHFKGIYLPYWTFDADTFSSYQGEYGIDHTRKDRNGNTHTETDWHRTSGTHREFINDELVLASKNHDMSMLRKLEPFDTENNKAYKPEYIAGFVAERYSLGLKDAWTKAMTSIKEKLKRHVSDKITQEHHADRVRNVKLGTDYSNITYKYLLLPIWVSNFKYNDQVYQFMVNGQTGKVAGKTPISVPKVVITVVAVIAIIAILYYLGVWN